MLRGDWLRKLALLGVVTAILTLIVNSYFSIRSEYYRSGYSYREYQKQTDDYEKESADKVARECDVIIPSNPAFRDCLVKGIRAYQKDDTSKQDLKAQQDMAYWALLTFVVSSVGLIVSICGLMALLVSLRQTRTAIRDTRELGEAAARSYLEYKPRSLNVMKGTDGSIGIAITGTATIVGQSYAKNISAGLWIGCDKPNMSLIPETVTLNIIRSYCAPSVVLENVKVQAPTKNFSFDWQSSKQVWVCVFFSWEDAFLKMQTAQFRYQLMERSSGTPIGGSNLLGCSASNNVAIASA